MAEFLPGFPKRLNSFHIPRRGLREEYMPLAVKQNKNCMKCTLVVGFERIKTVPYDVDDHHSLPSSSSETLHFYMPNLYSYYKPKYMKDHASYSYIGDYCNL